MQAPSWLPDLASRVDVRIAQLLDSELQRWTDIDASLAEPLDALRRLVLAGGKRLRPAFCYWAFVGAGGDDGSDAWVDGAAALELQHVSAIIHDDVIDDSPKRHGAETIHHEFAGRHAARGWRGEDRRFGEGAAILTGNLAAAYADQLLAGASGSGAAARVFADLRLEVNAGQYLDARRTAGGDIDPDGALQICLYKSAKYTVERPLHLGAALAGGTAGLARLEAPLSAFGVPLGTAFQLRDDLLDAFGDPKRTGKPAGADLREGKATYLYALARGAATGEAASFLARRYGRADLTDGDVDRLQSIFVDTGARAATESLIDGLLAEALTALAALAALATAPLTGPALTALAELATYVVERDR